MVPPAVQATALTEMHTTESNSLCILILRVLAPAARDLEAFNVHFTAAESPGVLAYYS